MKSGKYMKKLDKKIVCQLINVSIEDEIRAGHEYKEILEAIPDDKEYEECSRAIVKIMRDEINHAIILRKIGETLECKEPYLKKEDEELLKQFGIVNHEIKIR